MINVKLEEFVCENVCRTASNESICKVVQILKDIQRLKPAEIGHLLYIFASAERAHKFNSSPIMHFKHLATMLKKIVFELECAICF